MRIGGRKVQNQTEVRRTTRQHFISPFLRLTGGLWEFVSFALIIFGGGMSKLHGRRNLARLVCEDAASAGTENDPAAIEMDIVVKQACVFPE